LSTRSIADRHDPYWKRGHHDWKFWFAMLMMFAAIGIYVMSDNLALVRR
jgi:hypothetical protein